MVRMEIRPMNTGVAPRSRVLLTLGDAHEDGIDPGAEPSLLSGGAARTPVCHSVRYHGGSVGYRGTATARMTRAPWCLPGAAWLLLITNPAPTRPWDRQRGSLGHRSRVRVGSATGRPRPSASLPSAARKSRSGPRPLSPTSPPCTHLTLDYSPECLQIRNLGHPLPLSRTSPVQHHLIRTR